ncbi:MAG: hypothetical protein GXP42_15350 [Chloroflexi bacterium]|nr:hypothetical protein [Chloroflexota bacterium]
MSAQTYFSDEFDLRSFASILARGWWLIALFAGASALAALVVVLTSQETYTAQADVALLNIRSAVVFDPDFTTVPEEAPPFGSGSDTRNRALMALAKNKSLLLMVQAEMNDALGESPAAAARLLGATRVVQMGDLLRFEVTWDNPEMAAAIANAWAANYVKLVNQAFVATGDRTPGEAQAAAQDAFVRYQQAQAEMQRFMARNAEPRLIRQIDELTATIDALQAQKNEAMRLAHTAVYSATNQLAQTSLNAALAQMDYAIEQEGEAQRRELDHWHARRADLNALRLRLKDVRSQLETSDTGAVASGDALALLLLRAGLTDSSSAPELLLQFDPVQLARLRDQNPLDVIDAMLSQVDEALIETDAMIQLLLQDLAAPSPPSTILSQLDASAMQALVDAPVRSWLSLADSASQETDPFALAALDARLDELERRRSALQAQLEAEQARRRELTRERDAAWDLYTTLDNKAREVTAQFATGAPQARIAIEAAPPLYRDPRNTKIMVLSAAALGALLGAVFVLTRERLARSRVALDDPSTTHNVQ